MSDAVDDLAMKIAANFGLNLTPDDIADGVRASGWRPPNCVITAGAYVDALGESRMRTIDNAITDLDGLPVGVVIRVDDGSATGLVYQKLNELPLPWYEIGIQQPFSSECIARHETPIEVIA